MRRTAVAQAYHDYWNAKTPEEESLAMARIQRCEARATALWGRKRRVEQWFADRMGMPVEEWREVERAWRLRSSSMAEGA